MKKFILTCVSGVFAFGLAEAQSIERSVIGSAGTVSTSGSAIISWTVGETVVNTASTGSVILTQGFQQPESSITSVQSVKADDGIRVYPNPSAGEFTLEKVENSVFSSGSLMITVHDGAGKLVFTSAQANLANGTSTIDLSNLPGGLYSLEVVSGNLTSTYKLSIIK